MDNQRSVGASPVRRAVRHAAAMSVLAAIVIPGGTLVFAPQTLAATPVTLSLTSAQLKVKTANGQSFYMTVDATDTTPTVVEGVVELARPEGSNSLDSEFHLWTFNALTASFTFNTTTQEGTFDTGTHEGALTTIDLTFKATAHKAESCANKGGSAISYTGTLTGKVTLATGISGGGTVGGTSETFTGTNTLISDAGCVPPATSGPCYAGGGWASDTPVDAFGLPAVALGKPVDQIDVVQHQTLSSPKGAERTDGALIEASPATHKAATLTVTTGGAGSPVTGTATISGGTSKQLPTEKCDENGKTETQTEDLYFGAKYASAAGHALTVHEVIGGSFSVPTSSTGVYEVYRIS
jgi:hypothetical protein